MANPLKAEIDIELDKSYKARLTIDAIMQIEDRLGIGIIKLVNNLQTMEIRVSDIVTVLTPALRGGGNDFQEADVKKIVANTGIIKSTEIMSRLLVESLAAEQEEDAVKKEEQ